MRRSVPPHPAKGSAEAFAWAQRMQLARRKKKGQVRAAGLQVEEKFFGPRGVFVKAGHTTHLKNPESEVRELYPWAVNDGALYRQYEVPAIRAAQRLWHAGRYVVHDVVKFFLPWAKEAAKRYMKEFSGSGDPADLVFSRSDIGQVALDRVNYWKREFDIGNFLDTPNPGKWFVGLNEALQWEVRSVASALSMPWLWAKGPFRSELQAKNWARANDPPQTWPPSQSNPGEEWHKGMASVARRYYQQTKEPIERAMFKGVEVAHVDSGKAARRLKMNREQERVIRPSRTIRKHRTVRPGEGRFPMSALYSGKKTRPRKNPLAVFGIGNPPRSVHATVEGVVYSRCLEIRAEKTKFKPGLYRHPFSRKAGVQILALDTGDLLVHSTRGVNLWEPI